jgi:hypothetical protein
LAAWLLSIPLVPRAIACACVAAACIAASLVWRLSDLPNRERWAAIFDVRIQCGEQISAALSALGLANVRTDFGDWLCERALVALSRPERSHLPARFRRRHVALFGTLPLLSASWLLPPESTWDQHSEVVAQSPQWQQLGELSASLVAPELDPLSEPERQKLRELSLVSQQLSKRAREGDLPPTWRRDLSRLHDTVEAAREDFEPRNEADAVASAVAILRSDPNLARAAAALGKRDALDFDAELRKFTGTEERAARQRAQQTLSRAEQTARNYGAGQLARALSEQSFLLALRGQAADRVKELISQLGPAAAPTASGQPSSQTGPRSTAQPPLEGQPLDEPGQTPPERAPNLHGSERRRLAERLQAGLQSGQFDFSSQAGANLEPAVSKLGEEAAQRLSRSLETYSAPAESARRLQALWEASRALAALERATRGPATPLPDPQQFDPGGASEGSPNEEQAGAPSPGHGGSERHERPAEAAMVPTTVIGKTQQEVELAHGLYHESQGQSWSELPRGSPPALPPVLPARGPDQLQGVARPNVPTEYREHVSRYFSLE